MEELTECPRCGRRRPPAANPALKGNCPYCLLEFALGEDPAPESADAHDSPPGPDHAPSSAPPPQRLGPYTLLDPLGAGGMGAVYRARHEGLGRVVALKLLKPEFAAQPGFTERFRREGQLLAALAHPHIIGVHDLGCEAGAYYLAMELVEGATLRDRLRRGRLPADEARALFAQMAQALDAAHQRGIVHRDIKPENVLIDARGQAKIADFGIAKLVGASLPADPGTEVGMVAGTRSYMAPEQLEPGRTIDRRADLYALAVVFYEMLTGELPLGVFAPPSQTPGVPPAFDAPILAALAKDPAARPSSAAEFLARVEQGRRSPTPSTERPSPRWLRPAVAAVALAGVVAIALFGGGPGETPVDATKPLAKNPTENPVPTRPIERGLLSAGARVWDVAFDPRDGQVATADDDGAAKFWNTAGGEALGSLAAFPQADLGYLRLAWSPTERILATAGGENVARLWDMPPRLADLPKGAKERHILRGHGREIVALAFSPDGTLVATGAHDRTVKLWSTADGSLKHTLTGPLDPVLCVAFSPDSARVAGGVMNGAVKLWETSTGNELPSSTGHAKRVWGLAFTPEGYLVSGSHDQTVKVCDPAQKKMLHTFSTKGTEVWSVAASSVNRRLACGAQDGTVREWNYETGEPLGETKRHTAAVVAVKYSPDGKQLASASLDRTARVVDVK